MSDCYKCMGNCYETGSSQYLGNKKKKPEEDYI
jgi:hypothetical protein